MYGKSVLKLSKKFEKTLAKLPIRTLALVNLNLANSHPQIFLLCTPINGTLNLCYTF